MPSKFLCPHCNTPLRIDVSWEITNVRPDEDMLPPGPDDWKQTLTAEQVGFVEQAKRLGLFAAFTSVLPHMRGSVPKCPERFFVGFFRASRQKRIPSFALEFFVQKYGGRISFFSAQGIGLVVSDGHPVDFVPLHLVIGDAMKSLSGNNKTRLSIESEPLRDWLRTRRGYCPPNSLLLDELRRKSIGEFANPTL